MNATSASVPDTCAMAFKEWAGVCHALTTGQQTLILRKGGIAEESGEFVPDQKLFWLYPTYVHEVEQGLLPEATRPKPPVDPSNVTISALAQVESIGFLGKESGLDALEGLHVWKQETLLKRFHYRSPGLWVLGVRIYHRPEPAIVTVTPEQTGCKTWVHLESSLSTTGVVPVLQDQDFSDRISRLQSILAANR